jgi:hypothetical protein
LPPTRRREEGTKIERAGRQKEGRHKEKGINKEGKK